jgi:DNA invertase Pin-like site-specific DNA recombinase
MRCVYSYLRYSSPKQEQGDSVRRQDAAALAWCRRNGGRLDADKRMEDRGLSGSDGSHIRRGALGQFLAEVEGGRILEGSVLILENLDRLSREEDVWVSVALLCQLVNAGITVVTLSPREQIYERGGDLSALMNGVMELGRGASETSMKKERLQSAWGNKKAAARDAGTVLSATHCPQWLEVVGGKFVPIPGRVAVLRQIFDLAASGHGIKSILKRLNADGAEPWGYSGRWSKSYVWLLLKSRNVLGVYQPHHVVAGKGRARKRREPEGEPIVGYYPGVVDQVTWDRAQAAIAGRFVGGRPVGGRVGRLPDLFGGLLWDAANHCKMLTILQTRGKPGARTKCRYLCSVEANDGRVPMVTFPYRVFEWGILSRLKEVKAADVLGAEPEGESATLAAELARKTARLKDLEAAMAGDDGDVKALVDAAKTVARQRQVLLRKLAEARGKEANPRGEALAEMQTLIDLAADPHNRLRLRSLLRTVVESVQVLVVPRKAVRLAAVQVTFAGGTFRTYLLDYRPAGNGRKESRTVDSFTHADGLDLRRPRDVAGVRRWLDGIHDGRTADVGPAVVVPGR